MILSVILQPNGLMHVFNGDQSPHGIRATMAIHTLDHIEVMFIMRRNNAYVSATAAVTAFVPELRGNDIYP